MRTKNKIKIKLLLTGWLPISRVTYTKSLFSIVKVIQGLRESELLTQQLLRGHQVEINEIKSHLGVATAPPKPTAVKTGAKPNDNNDPAFG